MRELKFRAWDKQSKVMRPISRIDLDEQRAYFSEIDAGGPSTPWWYLDGDRFSEAMQYTGLKDKNGTEVYEQSILSTRHGIGVVAWGNAAFVVRTYDYSLPLYQYKGDCEVIGNIYEHKHLLEDGDAKRD